MAVTGVAAWVLTLGLIGQPGRAADPADPGDTGAAFDAAPFGFAERQEEGKAYGIRWGEPRKIRRIVVEFAPGSALPSPEQVQVQYWQRAWDGRPDPVATETAAGGEGWAQMDDWTNGEWRTAQTQVRVDGGRWTFTFEPTGPKEFKDLQKGGVAYRKTLKIRLAAESPIPRPTRFQTFTDAVRRPLAVRIMWGPPAEPSIKVEGDDPCHLQAFNGTVAGVRPAPGSSLKIGDDLHWTLPANSTAEIQADVLMAIDPVSSRYDRTIVTVRSGLRPFSFAADEVARGERILVDDLGVLVVRGDDAVTLEGYRQMRKEFPGRSVYDRVFDAGEQTLPRAWGDMPLKRPLAFVHGLPGDRNVMRQEPNGDIGISNVRHWFSRNKKISSPKDSERKGWRGDMLWLRFGLPGDERRGGRELRDGYLPLLRTWWQEGPICYEQLTILDKLEPDLSDVRLDDPTVLLMKLRVVNTSGSTSGQAVLTLTSSADGQEKLAVQQDRVQAVAPEGPRFRYLIRTGQNGTLTEAGDAVKWSMDLPPGASHELFFAIPSITLTEDERIEALRRRDVEADSKRVCDFWRNRTAQGAQIETHEPWLNDFYKAHLRHLEINCLKDLESPRRYAHVGTFHYGVYCNESAMMISDLDRRGYHDVAEQCLQTWLDFQGTVSLPGNFRSREGQFYGAGGSESGGYNKHHGYVMWCMAEHWWTTRDRQWMERAAPKLVQACEWVIRERQATMTKDENGTPVIEWGFLPAGGLEDVQDYWYWLATNACTAWGFRSLADALADFGHPEAARLQKEARAYQDDVMKGVTESRIRSPVVRLRDGTYVPKFASRLYERGRCVGWIREVLEGAICLLLTGLVDPDSPEARWIMKDYEDNLYISDRYGYSIPVFDRFWLSRGGFSMQANLLDSPIPYIQRDEVKHYLRTYFNAFASAFYPEVRMCNEHSLPELGYPAGDHFKTSDESQSTYWLRLMFVHERGPDLYLGQAVPRYWLESGRSVGIERAASHFGPLSLRITSQAAQGEIRAVLTPPTRNHPRNIYLRLRHPQATPMRSVTLNGQDHAQFDAKKEWVVLPGTVTGAQEVIARYSN